MMRHWITTQAIRWLTNRGYFVIPKAVPQLIISYGTGTMQKQDDGSMTYMIRMPVGHRLMTLHNTVLTMPVSPKPE
jgi:hypothetical protein